MHNSFHDVAKSFVALFDPPAEVVIGRDAADLGAIHAKLPARLPALYEYLVLHYRWQPAEVDALGLLANPGPAELLQHLLYDHLLSQSLLPAGLIPFARPAGGSYDPVCFNTQRRRGKRDYQIVRVDHEEILSRCRIGRLTEVAPSFYDLVIRTVHAA